MIKINKFILIICFSILLLMFIIYKDNILNIVQNICKTNFVGGQTIETSKDLENKINSRNEELQKIRAELESLRNNIKTEKINTNNKNDDDIFSSNIYNNNNNTNIVNNNRDIIESSNKNPIDTIIENDIQETTENSENIDSENIDSENIDSENTSDLPVEKKPIKPYEDMCEDNYNNKKKKSKYMDLKLNLNTTSYLEPFNNNDFNEYGNFNC